MAPLVAAGDAPSPHVSLHVLLSYFQTGVPSLVVDVLLVAAAVGYVLGTRALVRRRAAAAAPAAPAAAPAAAAPAAAAAAAAPAAAAVAAGSQPWRWPPTRTVAWLAGLVAVFVAVGSGLAAYDDLNPSAHVVQHVLLMMVAPPLLFVGRPVTVLLQVLRRPAQVRAVRVLGSRVARGLTGPVAWPLYYGTMAAYFLTPLYALSVRTTPFHDATHGWFLAVGCLFWAGAVGDDLPGHRRSPTGRLLSLMAGMPVESAIAVALLFWPAPLAPGETVSAAHHAGAVLWIGAMATSGVGVALVLTRWIGVDARTVRRHAAAVAAGGGRRVGGYDVRADGSAVPVSPVPVSEVSGRRRQLSLPARRPSVAGPAGRPPATSGAGAASHARAAAVTGTPTGPASGPSGAGGSRSPWRRARSPRP